MAFCLAFAGLWALRKNNALVLANQSMRWIGYKPSHIINANTLVSMIIIIIIIVMVMQISTLLSLTVDSLIWRLNFTLLTW